MPYHTFHHTKVMPPMHHSNSQIFSLHYVKCLWSSFCSCLALIHTFSLTITNCVGHGLINMQRENAPMSSPIHRVHGRTSDLHWCKRDAAVSGANDPAAADSVLSRSVAASVHWYLHQQSQYLPSSMTVSCSHIQAVQFSCFSLEVNRSNDAL